MVLAASGKSIRQTNRQHQMIILRRLILIVALMFWQGGFMFYGSVVITVGAQVLGSEMDQGFVTQAVGTLDLGMDQWRENHTGQTRLFPKCGQMSPNLGSGPL
jgi:hypothetical protein